MCWDLLLQHLLCYCSSKFATSGEFEWDLCDDCNICPWLPKRHPPVVQQQCSCTGRLRQSSGVCHSNWWTSWSSKMQLFSLDWFIKLNKYTTTAAFVAVVYPGTCISFLFTRCRYLSIFNILLLTNYLGLNLKIRLSTKIRNRMGFSRSADRMALFPVWPNPKMAISQRRIIRFTPCMVLGWGFWGCRIEWRYFRFDEIQDGRSAVILV